MFSISLYVGITTSTRVSGAAYGHAVSATGRAMPLPPWIPGPNTISGVDEPTEVPDAPPTLPSRTAFLLAFLSVVVAGCFGVIIRYGLADISADGGSGAQAVLGALVGAVLAAGGVGIVAVLVLRAQAEWNKTAPGDEPEPPGGRGG